MRALQWAAVGGAWGVGGCVLGPPADDARWSADGGRTLQVCGSGGEYSTVQRAIDAAASGDTLTLCAGTFKERLSVSGKSLTLVGAGAGSSVLDANGSGTALKLSGGATVTLVDLTVQNAKSSGIHCTDGGVGLDGVQVRANKGSKGAGLYALRCALDVVDSSFEGNTASSRGAGLYAESSSGSVTGSSFLDNIASSRGGGVALQGGSVELASAHFEGNSASNGGGMYQAGSGGVVDSTFLDNACGYNGGGLYVDAATGDVAGNHFEGNQAGDDGGGLFVDQSTLTIADNVFLDNDAVDDAGGLRVKTSTADIRDNHVEGNTAGDTAGGVKISHRASTFSGNTVVDNVAGGKGGGLHLDEDTTEVRDCVFEGNQASSGAGLYQVSGWEVTEVWDSRFTDNLATGGGGGIAVVDSPYGVSLVRVELGSNAAAQGGGLYASNSGVAMAASLVQRNSATSSGGGLYLSGGSAGLDNWVAYRNSAPSGSGLYASGVGGSGVRNAVFYKNSGGVAVRVASGSLGWTYSAHYGQSNGDFSGMTDPTGTNGNLAEYPAFDDASEGEFGLQAVSPLVDAGDPGLADPDGSRSDIGMYGGPYGAW
jgi:hypothetical protein